MEEITDADHMHGTGVCKVFEIKNLGEYHDFHLKKDTLLLADVFENFRKRCLKLYQHDSEKFLSSPGLPWQADLKTTKAKLELLTNIGILVNSHGIHRCAKANNKYMKDYDKNKKSLYLKYWDVNNLYVLAMSPKLPVNKFEWVEDTSQFNENFIKNYNEESDEGCDVIHIRNLKEAINYGLVLKKVHRVIKFNQKDLLKPYIYLNNELRQRAKNNLEKKLFKLMNNAVFEKNYGKCEKIQR